MTLLNRKSIKLNAILNVARQLCSVLFPLITIPYVTRILHAENLGKVNFSSSVISYFSLIASMGIVNYGIREGAKVRNDKNEFHKFANEIFTINIITTLLAYILLIVTVLVSNKLQSYIPLLVVQSSSMLFVTLGADWINNIYEDFLYITIRSILAQFISLALMFIFVRNTNDYVIYAFVTVFAQVGVNIVNMFYIRKYTTLKLVFPTNLRKHLKPIVVLFFNNVAMTVYINSDSTMLGYLVDDSAVGIYNISTRIYTVIKHVINAIVTVALPRLSAYASEDKGKYRNLLNEVFESIITVLFPTITGLFMISTPIVSLLSGDEFIGAATALKVLSISLVFAVFGGFYTVCVLVPNRKDKSLLIATSFAAVCNIILNFFFIPLWSYIGASITTLFAELIVMLITWHSSRSIVSLRIKKDIIIPVIICCAVIIVECIAVKMLLKSDAGTVVVSVVISTISYIVLMAMFKNPLILSVINKLKNFIKR